jgi:hypothetical protein
MRDLIGKLSELEASAPKASTGKKMLTEDSTTPPVNKPLTLKDMFENMSQGIKQPIPVVGKQGDTQQTGAGFLSVTDNSPAAQALQKAVSDLAGQNKAQIVVPTTPQDVPAGAGAAGVRAVQQQPGQLQQQVQEADDPTWYGPFSSSSLAKANAVDEIGGGQEGVNYSLTKKDDGYYWTETVSDKLDELSPKTLKSYSNKAKKEYDRISGDEDVHPREYMGPGNTHDKRAKGINMATKKLAATNEGAKVDRMVKHIEKSERKAGKSKDEAEDIAWATANKRGMLDNKSKKKVKESVDKEIADIRKTLNSRKGKVYTPDHPEQKETEQLRRKLAKLVKSKEVKEGDIAPTNGIDTKGAGLGAGRSQTTLEGKKPDFLDLDKDGNKKESMKKAAADKKKQKVKESMNHKLSAARLEGKSHGLRGHAHYGKAYEDLEEMRAYHEGYKEGLDESYGMGMYEDSMPATVPGMDSSALSSMPTMEDEMDEGIRDNLKKAGMAAALGGMAATGGMMAKGAYDYHKKDPISHMSSADVDKLTYTNEDEFGEGNAFTDALAKTPKGGKFTVGGKTYTDRTNYDAKVDEYAFEAWDRELQNLLNEGTEVNEGLSVSVSKGQENAPDSVTITAQDAEADQLLQLVKHAGLGLFGDEPSEPSSAMSVQPSMGEPDEVGAGGVDVEVVDGSDSMLSLMQKLGGVEASGPDYEEEGDEEQLHGNHEETHEETCNECGGMMEADHSCGSKMDEEETPDQLEAEVAEDNAPDSDEAETSADEDAEAEEDKALAGAASGDEEEIDEGFTFESIYKKFAMLEGSGDKPKHPEHDEKDDKDFDDAEDEEVTESEQLDELSPELLGRAGVEAGKRQSAAAGPVIDSPLTDPFSIEIGQFPQVVRSTKQAKSLIDRGLLTPDTTVIVTTGGAKRDRRTQTQAKRIPELKDLFGNEGIGPSKFWGKKVDKFNAAAKNATFRDQAKAQTANMSPAQKRQYDAMIKSGELNEWANQTGKGPGKGTDASFEQDIEFMTKVISGGLNKPKSTGQTTVPVIAGQEDRMTNPKETVTESVSDWAKLAGIKKS